MSGILISPSVFHIVLSFEMEEGAGFEPAQRLRLVPLRTGCPASWASPPVKWRRGRDSNSRGRWPRRVSSALDSLLVLSSPWSGKRPSLASAGWSPLEEFNLRLSVRTGASCALDEAGKWSPREDFNLHYRVRSPVVCALAYEGTVVARGIEPRRTLGPPGRVELPLAAYRAATLRSVGGVVTSRGIEPRSLGLQPSAMTTLARWSLWWSRRRESNPRLRVTRAPCFRQHFVDVVPPAGVEPAWFRLKGGRMAALPRRVRRTTVGCRAGIRTRIFPVNSRTCCRCHHPTSGNEWSGREDSNLHAPARGRWAADYPTTRSIELG